MNCSNQHEIVYKGMQFASGTTVIAYQGTFRNQPVIVKKPRQSTPGGLVKLVAVPNRQYFEILTLYLLLCRYLYKDHYA